MLCLLILGCLEPSPLTPHLLPPPPADLFHPSFPLVLKVRGYTFGLKVAIMVICFLGTVLLLPHNAYCTCTLYT